MHSFFEAETFIAHLRLLGAQSAHRHLNPILLTAAVKSTPPVAANCYGLYSHSLEDLVQEVVNAAYSLPIKYSWATHNYGVVTTWSPNKCTRCETLKVLYSKSENNWVELGIFTFISRFCLRGDRGGSVVELKELSYVEAF